MIKHVEALEEAAAICHHVQCHHQRMSERCCLGIISGSARIKSFAGYWAGLGFEIPADETYVLACPFHES